MVYRGGNQTNERRESMSGGYFDYKQFHIDQIIEDIEEYLEGYKVDDDIKNEKTWGASPEDLQYMREHHRKRPNIGGYSDKTLKEFRKGLNILKKASVYAQRIDWLLSGDDGEDDFHKRLKEELEQL